MDGVGHAELPTRAESEGTQKSEPDPCPSSSQQTSPAEPERVLFLLPAFPSVAGTEIPVEAGAGIRGFWQRLGIAELFTSKAQSLSPADLNGNFASSMTVGVGLQAGKQVQIATGCGIISTLHY